jgi:microcystin-dependent protein
MVESTTQHYGWTKPEVTKSASTWGGFLNTDLDSIDALIFANQQGIAPIGAGALWFSATEPANWLICDGRSLATTGTYAALFAIISYTWGGSGANFNLPNPFGRALIGAGSGLALNAQGGAATVTLDATMIPAHTHTATQPAHTHTATQPTHSHSDSGHGHGVNDPQHYHSTVNTGLASGVNIQPGSGFNLTGTTTTDYKPTGITIQAGAANIQAASAGAIAVAANTGGGAAHNNWPPYLAINFIIRFA